MVVYTLEQRWEVGLRSTYRRCQFCKKKIIFSDETHFDLGGYVNIQNCRIWGTENPHAYIEKLTHPKRVTFWCGFWSRGIIDCHLAEATLDVLRPVFEEHIINRRADVV